jgi:adenine-specific DNA-methyltransferase
MPVSRFIPAFTFAEDRLAALKALAPEAFNADGRLDWDALKIALGEVVEDGAAESFGLNWPGKRAARRLALTPVHKTLVPVPGEGVDEGSTRNIFIEGDNLDALKLLRKAYAGRVKMIYIDPPYNTGNDFIYKDDFRESAEEYQQKTGQRGEEGERLVANPKSSGRFHGNWLNMIYPRLLLAREMMREDGLIFASVDENEAHNLRQTMDEVFGAQNFLSEIVWRKKTGAGAKPKGYIVLHEYVLCYAKNADSINIRAPLSDNSRALYKKRDEHYQSLGPYATWPLDTTSMDTRANLRYPILHQGQEIWPRKQWLWSKERTYRAQAENKLVFSYSKEQQTWSVRFKGYLYDESGDEKFGKPTSVILDVLTQEGTRDIEEFFGREIFPFPKPVKLLKLLLSIDTGLKATDEEIVLDFFAGSASTAQAILEMNSADAERRRFVLVQLPEATNGGEFPTIADIGKERIRRVIKKLKEAKNERTDDFNQPELDLENNTVAANLDLGFKVFKIEDSPFKRWADFDGEDIPAYQARLDEAADHPLRTGWVAEAVLTEIALQEGFPLDSAMAVAPEFKRNVVRRVSHESSQHRLFVCLDERIYADTIANVRLEAQDIFICFDHALGDEAKLRLADACKLKVI